jgi:hypothetical protein
VTLPELLLPLLLDELELASLSPLASLSASKARRCCRVALAAARRAARRSSRLFTSAACT